jgi:metal-responsive CopG/Arc/MetJ family transcriptional regulator
MSKEPTKIVPILMPKSMAKSLKETALRSEKSASEIIRQMLIDHLNGQSNPKDQNDSGS